jgi:hypothetical protein
MHPALEQSRPPPLQSTLSDETLGADDFSSPNSPLMQPVQVRCKPSPSPPLRVAPRTHAPRFSPGLATHTRGSLHRRDLPGPNDYTLVELMGNGRHPEITREAGTRPLPPIDLESERCHRGDRQLTPEASRQARFDHEGPGGSTGEDAGKGRSSDAETGKGSLQHMAADALEAVQVAVAVDSPSDRAELPTAADISASTRVLSLHDEPYSPGSRTPHDSSRYKHGRLFGSDPRSAMLSPPSAGLPPIVSPRSESNGQSLPSIHSTLGDIKLPPPDQDLTGRHGHHPTYPHSPPAGSRQLPPLSGAPGSPPISPPDSYHRSLPSPRSLPASSPFASYANTIPHRPSVDYSSGAGGDTSGTEYSAPAPSTSASTADRMSIDGITNQGVGVYMCPVTGCKAAPFQTQYLLNSHANVHSSARPHYCPVPGCSRSEGGKGFKRKNEMIRHGLVHDSPGYVCPFCPDRDHKYPRPDNLQR